MGLIRSFLAASLWGQVALICLLVAEVFNWLCFCMNDWGRIDLSVANDDNKNGIGVWKLCGNQEVDANCNELDGWRVEWYGAFQAFAIIAFMGVNLAFLFLILTLFVPQCLGNREVAMASIISSFVAAVGYTICLIIFGVRFDSTFDRTFDREVYASAFYLAIFTALLAIVAGVCGIMTAHGGKAVAQSSANENNQRQAATHQAHKK